ncbi:MAG: cupin domain-containing protein [Bdellovibrionales bacterium]|nr:cupin domain-containing protein [Bdellovibrionales bacterium]
MNEKISVIAPDGMAVDVLCTDAKGVNVAEGKLPAQSSFSTHYHKTLEQITYVLHGRIHVSGKKIGDSEYHRILEQGEWILTKANESLQFFNRDQSDAKVLFICSPPYPADDSDTVILDQHRELTKQELRMSIEQAEKMKSWATSFWDKKIVDLTAILDKKL